MKKEFNTETFYHKHTLNRAKILSLTHIYQKSQKMIFQSDKWDMMMLSITIQAVFASWIPEITELAAQRSKYGGTYSKDVRRRYTHHTQRSKKKKKNMLYQTFLNSFIIHTHNYFMIFIFVLLLLIDDFVFIQFLNILFRFRNLLKTNQQQQQPKKKQQQSNKDHLLQAKTIYSYINKDT